MAPGELPVAFDEVRPKNVEQLKLLNRVVFPVKYTDQLYKDCMQFPQVTALAYHNDVLVGGIMARFEKQPSGRARMYVASLGVLAPYRGHGIGGRLLARSVAGACADAGVDEAVVHTQAGNDEALRFYRRHGFEVVDTIPNYYPALTPPDALLLARPTPTPPPPALDKAAAQGSAGVQGVAVA